MLKGVNKKIIEVSDCENKYFEKAIFFVRPPHADKSEEVLRVAARRYMSGAGAPAGTTAVAVKLRSPLTKLKYFLATKMWIPCAVTGAVAIVKIFG